MVRTAITKEELTRELRYLRKRVAELETLETEQQTSEKQLLKFANEQKYRVVFESANDIIILMDNNGKVIDVNDKLIEILGYKKKKLVGKNLSSLTDILTEKSLEKISTNIKKRLTGEYVPPYEIEVVHKNGTLITLEINARAMKKDGKIVGDLAILRDITERKQAEEALCRSEAELKDAQHFSHVGSWEWNIKTNQLKWSDEMYRIFGIDKGEFSGDLKDIISLVIHPDDREKVNESNARVITDKKSIPLEYRVVWSDGSIHYIWAEAGELILDSEGNSSILRGFAQDITERKKAEEALKISEERFRRLADNARDVIFRFRQFPSLGFDYISPATLRISGYTQEEFYNNPMLIFKVVHPNSRSLLREITSHPQDYLDKSVIMQWIHKNGEIVWTEQRAVPVYGNDGELSAIEGIIRDITLRRQTEEKLRESEVNFRTYLDKAPDGICLYDLQGTFLYGNKKAEEILGYRQDELIGSSFFNLNILPQKYLARAVELLALNAQGLPTGPDEFEVIKKDGSIIWVGMSTTPIKQRDKTIIINSVRDINDRKQAEVAKKVSEENFRNSIDSSPMGVLVFDTNENILYANRAILNIYGFNDIEELRNTPVKERYTPESYAEYLTRREKFYSGEVTALGYELSIKCKDGTIRHLQAFRKEIIWSGQRQFQILYTDITQRKKAEDAMRESRTRFRELARLLPQSIWETDENGVITYTNEKTMEIYGYSREDTKPSSYLDNLIPQDRERAAKNIKKIFQGEILEGIPYTALRKDGSVFPVLVYASAIVKNGKGVGLRGVTIDVTEQKMAEKRMEQAAQEWRTTFDSLTDMVCIIGNDFRINRVNRAYANMLNQEPQELLGKICYELIHNADCPHNDCPHRQTMRTGKPAVAEFYEPCLKTYVEVSTSPVFDENGNIKGSVHVMRNISERKHMEQHLMLTDRLASVGELASGVAHELNNPLTSVIGFSQLLMEGEVPDSIKEDLNLINSEAQRAASIVKNLLTFARKHAAVKQATRINNLIEDVLKLRAYEHKVNNIEVIRNFNSDIPEIMVDYFQIQQVFLNLIINAEFFMSEAHQKGVLTISTERVRDFISISFADDGPGIPAENLSRIFDPFFTTKEVGKGTGLGLSICHGIVTEHGGTIFAESEVGKGTTFHIELPVHS